MNIFDYNMKNQFFTNKEDIQNWLLEMKIYNCTINDDFTVYKEGDVDLRNKGLSYLPVQFGIVKGAFDCSHNQLTSLKGSPYTVGGAFFCDHNKITSLKYAPKISHYTFFCHHNLITHFDNSSMFIKGALVIENNPLQINRYSEISLERFIHYCQKDEEIIQLFEKYYEYSNHGFTLDIDENQFQNEMHKLKSNEEKETLENLIVLPNRTTERKVKL